MAYAFRDEVDGRSPGPHVHLAQRTPLALSEPGSSVPFVSSTPTDQAPHRGLGIPQGTAMTVGAVLGTGVLTLPALAAQVAGPASLVAWLALVLLSIPLSATFAGLGARYPDGGGVSTFARRAFGPSAAAVVGWCFYFAVPLGAPAAAGFSGAYVADLLGGGRATQIETTAVLIGIVAVMNWFGIRISGRAQLVIAGGLAALLGAATLVALPHARLAHLTPFAPHGWATVGTAASLLIWAFAGWEAVASLSAEYAHPEHEIPRVTAIALVVIGVLYLGVSFATVAALGPNPSSVPLSDLLELGVGPIARPATTLVAVLLSLGAMNAYFASCSRLGGALGRDGALPAWFGVTHGGIPRRSLLVVVALGLVALLTLGVAGLPIELGVMFVTGAFSIVYVVATAAAVRLLPRGRPVWWGALFCVGATAVLTAFAGWHLVPAAAISASAVAYSQLRERALVPASARRLTPEEPLP